MEQEFPIKLVSILIDENFYEQDKDIMRYSNIILDMMEKCIDCFYCGFRVYVSSFVAIETMENIVDIIMEKYRHIRFELIVPSKDVFDEPYWTNKLKKRYERFSLSATSIEYLADKLCDVRESDRDKALVKDADLVIFAGEDSDKVKNLFYYAYDNGASVLALNMVDLI